MSGRANGTTQPKYGQRCWYRGEPGVVVGGGAKAARVRLDNGKTINVAWRSVQRRYKTWDAK